ncbi:MAG: hypothetical protein A3J24_02935 [Deltaproteobacteria bacterium RIFCSPLOWO2_02_FULL_53_8]|nr:MAG: hypothetical protein A3J24_02935 [Deltaproteobacteria bacterium RIFCSPLOWO2_02_FULL_53_8]
MRQGLSVIPEVLIPDKNIRGRIQSFVAFWIPACAGMTNQPTLRLSKTKLNPHQSIRSNIKV